MTAPLIALAVTAVLAAAWAATSAAAQDGSAEIAPPPADVIASFEACEGAVDEAVLRAQVVAGARAAMRGAATDVNYRDVVEASWIAVRFDQRFARVVDAQIAIIRQDRNYFARLLDGNVPSRAEDVANRTADAVFGSAEFAALQRDLQEEIARRLAPRVRDAELSAQSRAAECVRLFLSQRYAETVRDAFAAEAELVGVDARLNTSWVGTSAALNLTAVIASLLAIVFRRVIRRVVQSIVRRLVGRIVAWASLVAGVVFLVYEAFAGAEGVFPVIRDELTGPETRVTIQTALIEELSTLTPDRLDARALAIGDEMITRWRRFEASHRAVLALAERSEPFRRFLEATPPERLEALSFVVAALRDQPPGGDAAVLAALQSGLLREALEVPGVARLIEIWAPLDVSLVELVAWRRLAGERFEAVLAADLPAVLDAEAVSAGELAALLALDDAEATRRVASIPQPARAFALSMPRDALLALAAQFDGARLASVFEALRHAPGDATRSAYFQRIARQPALVDRLDGAGDAIASSGDSAAALAMLLGDGGVWAPIDFFEDAGAVAQGRVSPSIFVRTYGWGAAIGLGLPALIGLLLLRRIVLLFGGRRRAAR